jgi:hypothetical protein
MEADDLQHPKAHYGQFDSGRIIDKAQYFILGFSRLNVLIDISIIGECTRSQAKSNTPCMPKTLPVPFSEADFRYGC